MSPFTLTCLGSPDVRGPDGDVIRFRTRKQLALLVVLAVEPSFPHRRDRLATLLWPMADTDEARHSLAVALSVLRGKLGADAFETGRETIRLVPGRVHTDLQDLDHGDPSDASATPIAPFLDEFDIPDATDFQQWKDGQQARLIPLLHAALARRIDHARRNGDSRRLEALGQQVRRIDPLSEEGIRALLEARAMAGDRIGAIRLYDRWRDELADELGATPSRALERMADRLRRRGSDRPAVAAPAPVPTEQWQERTFVGRGAEFRVCYDAWLEAREGKPRHVLVRGETGVGKTVLVERFVTAVALEGASVARLQCYELERELPFGTMGGLVSLLLDLPGAGTTSPGHLAELSRVVGKVRQRFPTLPAPQDSVGETARILFTEGVMALIAAIAEEHPVVLVVDDIPRADATSLAVLHLILRRTRDLPFMMVLTSSSALAAETDGARRFVDHADSIGLVQLDLDPMPERDCELLLGELLTPGVEPGPTIRRAILAAARGNPMILELLVADWRRRGDDCHALTLGAMTARAHRPPDDAIHHLIDRSLAALDSEARAVAELGALLGNRLNDLTMYTLVDLPVARTMRAMTSLAAHRVLRDAGNQLEFASEFVRGHCYVGMAAPLRRMLHALVADRLLLRDGGDEPIPGLEIAWHLVRADRLPEAIPYLLAGGRESIRRGAPHEADLALGTGMPALKGDTRRAAILLHAEALQELGRWDDSLRVLDSGDDGFNPSDESCRTVLRIGNQRWLGRLIGASLDDACESLLRIASSDIDPEVRVKALSCVTAVLSQSRNPEHISALGQAAHRLGELPIDDYQRIHVLHGLAWYQAQASGAKDALATLLDGVAIIDKSGTASSIAARTLLGAGIASCQVGQYHAAIPLIERAYQYSRRLDNCAMKANAAAGLALVHGRLGNAPLQIDWAREAILAARPDEWGICVLSAGYERGLGYAMEQRFSEANASLEELDARFDSRRPPWLQQGWRLCKADVLKLAGFDRRAIALARQATSDPLGHECFAGQFARWIAVLALSDDTPLHGLGRIQAELHDIGRYDAKDQVEIIAAINALEDRCGRPSPMRVRALDQRITGLPDMVRTILSKFGLLSPNALRPD